MFSAVKMKWTKLEVRERNVFIDCYLRCVCQVLRLQNSRRQLWFQTLNLFYLMIAWFSRSNPMQREWQQRWTLKGVNEFRKSSFVSSQLATTTASGIDFAECCWVGKWKKVKWKCLSSSEEALSLSDRFSIWTWNTSTFLKLFSFMLTFCLNCSELTKSDQMTYKSESSL